MVGVDKKIPRKTRKGNHTESRQGQKPWETPKNEFNHSHAKDSAFVVLNKKSSKKEEKGHTNICERRRKIEKEKTFFSAAAKVRVREGLGVGSERWSAMQWKGMEAPLPTQSQAMPITKLRVSNA